MVVTTRATCNPSAFLGCRIGILVAIIFCICFTGGSFLLGCFGGLIGVARGKVQVKESDAAIPIVGVRSISSRSKRGSLCAREDSHRSCCDRGERPKGTYFPVCLSSLSTSGRFFSGFAHSYAAPQFFLSYRGRISGTLSGFATLSFIRSRAIQWHHGALGVQLT